MAPEEESTEPLSVEEFPGGLIVRILESEVTMFVIPEIRVRLADYLTRKPQRMIFDLSRTAFLDSSGLAAIFKLQQEMAAHQGALYLTGLKASLRRVLDAVVRNGEIKIYDSIESARASFQ